MGLVGGNSTKQNVLAEEEKQGLLIRSIGNRAELNEFEQQNIEQVFHWLQGKTFTPEKVLQEVFVLNLHKRMFERVWARAGKFREIEKKPGLHPSMISSALKQLCEDTLFWTEQQVYPPDELAIRFKHRLLGIRCFDGGHARHSRLMADILIHQVFQQEPFTWGLTLTENATTEYLQAMKAADKNAFGALIRFARS